MKLLINLIGLFVLLIINLNCINCDNGCYLLKQSLLFYKAQRAGRLSDNDIPWRGNSVLNDKSAGSSVDSNGDGDLSKGYFDAGDGVKFNFPMAYSMTMLSWIYIEYSGNIEKCGLSPLYKEVLKWGTDFLIASHTSDNVFIGQVGNAYVDHNVWQPPENIDYVRDIYTIDSNNPGTDLAMEASAALSSASIVFKTSNPAYSQLCLEHSKKLYDFAMNSPMKKYTDTIRNAIEFYQSGGYNDEIAWGSIWLYKATNSQNYLTNSKSYYLNNNEVCYANEFSWDNKGLGVGILLYQLSKEQDYKTKIENSLNYWLPNGGIKYTNGGLAWLRQWASARYSMNMALIQSIYTKTGGSELTKYSTFAKNQLLYVLGENPKQQSFISGYGPKAPRNPHHRAAHHSTTKDINQPINNVYQLPGALIGGPPLNESWIDTRSNYESNEVALDYNIGLVGVVASYISDPSIPFISYDLEITTTATTSTTTTSATQSSTSSTFTSTTSFSLTTMGSTKKPNPSSSIGTLTGNNDFEGSDEKEFIGGSSFLNINGLLLLLISLTLIVIF
ncbi:hypothetical protein DDB_G0286321 [Dictyostelium discoideum AX4]|uniref:Endoglucanase n=1 Tax=Dictyostelium discoideum TaxID=44689 RepID=Q54M00_DICDI|nr:hypothetical protein DDB_G0286321 [Dictyostelium discoideum AX4]EAL64336.1 hypothetical protein DDB_G0286321 [Dictyostelium discoideum AX4]|eukprot:XP_637831.1 hypothetical protein DDB_G0286321 [Dictyostelium discoideum AX4]